MERGSTEYVDLWLLARYKDTAYLEELEGLALIREGAQKCCWNPESDTDTTDILSTDLFDEEELYYSKYVQPHNYIAFRMIQRSDN